MASCLCCCKRRTSCKKSAGRGSRYWRVGDHASLCEDITDTCEIGDRVQHPGCRPGLHAPWILMEERSLMCCLQPTRSWRWYRGCKFPRHAQFEGALVFHILWHVCRHNLFFLRTKHLGKRALHAAHRVAVPSRGLAVPGVRRFA